jgi:signal transduction histidine kinase/ActR/RegA family two-component response regulator
MIEKPAAPPSRRRGSAGGSAPDETSHPVLSAYHGILEAAVDASDAEELLRRSLRIIARLPQLSGRGALTAFLADPGTGALRIAAYAGAEGEPAPCREVAAGACLCGRALLERTALDADGEAPCTGAAPGCRLALPLVSRGRGLGVLHALFAPGRAPDPLERSLLERIASILGSELRHRLREDEHDRLEAQFIQAQKMEAVGRLAGGVAHDFNNILTAITSYSELGLLKLPPDSPLRNNFEQVLAGAERATGLTRQLLAFSRSQILAPRVIDANRVVADMGRMLRRLLGEDVELVTTAAPQPALICADRAQIEQVLINLAVNARDAMPRGGTLVLQASHAELDEGSCRSHPDVVPGAYVCIAVSDTGVGMTEEVQRRIFEPFFTTHEQRPGAGLGLAAVYGIVRQSGGHVWVYSELGVGTTFKIYFPALRDQGAPDAGEQPPRAPGGTETILVAEDDDAVRAVAVEALAGLGYRILKATGGAAALAVAAGHAGAIDLLLTDVVMPGMSGTELHGRLRALRPGLRALFVSGYTDEAIVHHGILEPGTDFLQKPFTPGTLALRVRQVLDRAAPPPAP